MLAIKVLLLVEMFVSRYTVQALAGFLLTKQNEEGSQFSEMKRKPQPIFQFSKKKMLQRSTSVYIYIYILSYQIQTDPHLPFLCRL